MNKKCLVTECLVIKAREKCQCEECKQYRKFRDIMIKQQIEIDARKIYYDALKEAGIILK